LLYENRAHFGFSGRDHLRLAPEQPHSWWGRDLDFTNVAFDGGDFAGARFAGGRVDFTRVEFSRSTVDFSQATGTAQSGLIPPPGSALPAGLFLPSAWTI
jgi:hypothetical protein